MVKSMKFFRFKNLLAVLFVAVGAIISPLQAFCASIVQIPLSRPVSGNSGYIFLSNADGTRWFAMTIVVINNWTELGGASTDFDLQTGTESFSAGVFLQLELDAVSNTINQLSPAYVDTRNGVRFHSGELINRESSNILYLYQYAFYDGSRITQSIGYDPAKIDLIAFPGGWLVNPGASASTGLLYGEVGGNISLKVVRHRSSDNIYLGGPYSAPIAISDTLSWFWRSDNVTAVFNGTPDVHISSTPQEHSLAQQIANSISESADSLHSLAESIDTSKPSVSGGIPDTPAGAELANNPVLTTIGSLWSNDILLTLSIISLTMTSIIILLRGTHG